MKQLKPSKTIWKLEVPVEHWLNYYPKLKERDHRCLCCNAVLSYKSPYICGDYIGIETEPCVSCGASPLHVQAQRKRK